MIRWVLCALATAALLGAAPSPGSQRGSGRPARPSFDGVWNSATVTPLERPPELRDKPVFTPAEAAEWERQAARRNEEPPPDEAAKRRGTGTYNLLSRVRHAHRQDAADLHRDRSAGWPHPGTDASRR